MNNKILQKNNLKKGLPSSAFRNRKTTSGFTQLVDFRLTKMFGIFARRQSELSPRRKFTTGFTLVESLIYIVIFSIIFLALVESVLYTNKTYLALRSTHSLENSAQTSLERMSRDIRNGYSIITASSTLGTSPGVLAIKTNNEYGTSTEVLYYLDSSKMLHVKENGVDIGKLTASTTPVSNLVFTRSTTTNSSAVKIDMSIQVFKNNATTTEKFWATYILRGSY